MNDDSSDTLAERRIREAVGKARGTAPGDVDVTLIDDVAVPGIVVFKARVGAARRGAWSFGVVEKGAVELDTDKAIAAIARAWHLGAADYEASAKDVASTVGALLGTAEPSHPIVTQTGIDMVPADWRARVALPKNVVLDGKPGVEFWVRMGRPPLARVRASFAPDDTPHVDVQPIDAVLDEQ